MKTTLRVIIMKKNVILLAVSVIVLLFFNLIIVFSNAANLSDNFYIFDENEFQQIQRQFQSEDLFDYLGERKSPYSENAYKYYTVRSEEFRDAALANSDISPLISDDDHRWAVPLSSALAIYYQEDDEWKLAGLMNYRSDSKGETVDRQLVQEEVLNVLKRGEHLVLGPVFFKAVNYSTVFAYFKTDADQYVIPFSWIGGQTGLRNGILYSAKTAVETLEEYYPIPETAEDYDPEMMGDSRVLIEEPETKKSLIHTAGILHSQKTVRIDSQTGLILLFGNVVLLFLITVIVLRRRKA